MAETCRAPDGSEMWALGPLWLVTAAALLIGATPMIVVFGVPLLVGYIGSSMGYHLAKKTAGRREMVLEKTRADEKELMRKKDKRDSDEWENVEADTGTGEKTDGWDGIIGFFHPFCNAGGGGERVLWVAIRATQKRWPNAKCVVYTGDHDVDKRQILERVAKNFHIHLHSPTITFLYLTQRHWVLASTWPHFTLLGQSIGSIILAWDAFSLLVPDIFVDTMGYAFALGFCKILFPSVPTGAYVHYPTISTDMLSSLSSPSNLGVNAGQGAGVRGTAKRFYWRLFAYFYTWVGTYIDVVMTNSTWTLEHITSLWGPSRRDSKKSSATTIFPPVAVGELETSIQVSDASELKRESILLYIAQFRPEKNHKLILAAFAQFMATKTAATTGARLALIGSVRDDNDKKLVYELRLLANELQIRENVDFHLDASWATILEFLGKASVGVNGMWNEHFGIGVVEYQAAGLISVVHDSGGPKRDIVVEIDGAATGFHATSAAEFAAGFEKALSLRDKVAMRLRARKSAKRFTEEEFGKKWVKCMDALVGMRKKGEKDR